MEIFSENCVGEFFPPKNPAPSLHPWFGAPAHSRALHLVDGSHRDRHVRFWVQLPCREAAQAEAADESRQFVLMLFDRWRHFVLMLFDRWRQCLHAWRQTLS